MNKRRFIRLLTLGYNIVLVNEPADNLAYGTAYGAVLQKSCTLKQRALDPISVAGRLHIDTLCAIASRSTYTWGKKCLTILTDEHSFRLFTEFEGFRGKLGVHSEAKWRDHLAELCSYEVLRRVQDFRNDSRLYFRYFEVPKDEISSRSIVDGTPINDRCATPPSLNFPALAEVTHILSCFPGGKFLIADIRHFFHQIRIPSGLGRIFSIKCEDKTFELRVLPMGFSWAPYLAQCLAWIIVLAACPTGHEMLPVRDTSESPPAFAWAINKKTKAKQGAVFVWIDNVLVISSNEGFLSQLRSQLMKSMKRLPTGCNVEWKYIDGPCDQALFLGIEFSWEIDKLFWKHAESNIARWRVLETVSPTTVRDIKRVIGVIMWDTMVTQSSFASVYDVRMIAKEISHQSEESFYKLKSEDLKLLSMHVVRILSNKRSCALPPIPISHLVLAFSDASSTHTGLCVLRQSGEILLQESIPILVSGDIRC